MRYQADLQIEGRSVALAGVFAHDLGRLARRDAMKFVRATVDKVVEAVGMPQRSLGEAEAGRQTLRLLRRLDQLRQSVGHAISP